MGGHEIAKLTTEREENSVNMFQIFETHMVQKPNKWVERLKFTSIQQNEETIDEYMVRLQIKAERCNFDTNKDNNIGTINKRSKECRGKEKPHHQTKALIKGSYREYMKLQ